MKLIIPTDIADIEVEEETEDRPGGDVHPMPVVTRITVDGKPVKSINFKTRGKDNGR